jgi:hypothetical protein
MAGNDTLTTATQNLVVAFNSLNKTQQYTIGQFTSPTYPAAGPSNVVIYHGRSRVVSVNIINTGGTVELYNSSTTSVVPSSALVFKLDGTATLGRHEVSSEFSNGIVLSVYGSTQVNVTYAVY